MLSQRLLRPPHHSLSPFSEFVVRSFLVVVLLLQPPSTPEQRIYCFLLALRMQRCETILSSPVGCLRVCVSDGTFSCVAVSSGVVVYLLLCVCVCLCTLFPLCVFSVHLLLRTRITSVIDFRVPLWGPSFPFCVSLVSRISSFPPFAFHLH